MITTENGTIKSHYINVKCELKLTRGRPFVQLIRLRLVPSSWIMQRDDDGQVLLISASCKPSVELLTPCDPNNIVYQIGVVFQRMLGK